MEKQVIRQLQQSGNRLNVCIAPEIREALQAEKGDNLAFEFEPDSGVVKMSKVVLPNPGSDDVPADNQADNQTDNQADNQTTETTNIEFCPNCGSNEIDVNGSKILCHKCDALFEPIAKGGFRLVKMSPLAGDIDDIQQRLEQVEQDVQDIDEQLNPEPDEDEVDFLDDYWGRDEDVAKAKARAKVPVGAESDEDEDEDDDI